MMAQAGATHVVVMERAHPETIKVVVKAGKDFGLKVMGQPRGRGYGRGREEAGGFRLRFRDSSRYGYDERRGLAAMGKPYPSPLDQLREVVAAVGCVRAVGGLSIEQAIRTPEYGAPLVVLGAPLTIDADAFKTASGNLEDKLRLVCDKVHAYRDSLGRVRPTGERTK